MGITYQVLSLALLLSLSRAGLGQTASAPTREDSVKGQIWTATARRIWADEKATPSATKWATGTDFSKWVLTPRNDKDELGSLWKAVLTRVGKGQPATPTQVVRAIIAEVSQLKAHKTGALAKVNIQSLQIDLAPFVPAGSVTSAAVAVADSATPTAALPAGATRTVAEDQNPAPEVRALPTAPTYTTQQLEPRYFGLPPALAGVALTLLGAVLGFGIAYSRLKSKRRHHRHHTPPAPPTEPENSSIMTSPQYRKLQKQNENLSTQLQQLKKQLTELQKQLPVAAPASAGVPAPAAAAHISPTSLKAAAAAAQAAELPPTPAVAAPTAAPLETADAAADDALFSVTFTVPQGLAKPAPASAGPPPAVTRYGPVQESAFLEERKIVDAPLPQLALMLTVNPRNPEQATFTLNPNVDQARLIGDGLTRLQKFFDYDPPLGGRITSVTATTTGLLQRHADGWQVVQRARLTIS